MAVFCTTPVTLVPMMLLMVVVPLPAPLLVIVPLLLTPPVCTRMVPAPGLLNVRLPLPVTPPLMLNVPAAGPRLNSVRPPLLRTMPPETTTPALLLPPLLAERVSADVPLSVIVLERVKYLAAVVLFSITVKLLFNAMGPDWVTTFGEVIVKVPEEPALTVMAAVLVVPFALP